MTITGSNTSFFGFQKLGSNDDAGYSTINEVVDGIDSILNSSDRLLKAGLSPTTGYTIKWDGADWISGTLDSAGITNAAIIDTKIATDAVTTIKIQDGAVTSAKIADGTIVNADINSAAAIADTKLATISTAGKVANSATTASSSNGASTIVSRDASGNFAADTITASLSGTATRATNVVGGSAGSLPYQTGTSATGMLSAGSNGHVLTYNTATSAPVWQAISSGSVTLAGDVTGAANANTIANGAVTSAKILDDTIVNGDINSSAAIAYSKLNLTGSILNADLAGSIAYAKLASDAKTYSVASTATAGVYFTASGDFTAASLSSASTQNPFVITNHASTAITLSLPTGIGSVGDTITVCQYGAAATTISPKSGAAATINGSTSNTYVLAAQYSVVTLLCINSNTWIITGDYI